MKKKLTKLLALLLSLLALICFSLACAPSTPNNGGEGQTPPQHTHEYSTIKFDETNHWKECSCGEKAEVTAHSLTDGKCSCGYEKEEGGGQTPIIPDNPTHTHEYKTVTFDDANHWKECSCGDKKEITQHTFTDGKCACGYEKKEEGGGTVEHTHDYTINNFDDVKHWKECSCGEKAEVTAHSLTDGKCACGYEKEEEGGQTPSTPNTPTNPDTPTHTHNFAILKYNQNNHWKECACGEKAAAIAHSGGTATCTKKAVCATCGQQYGEYGDHAYGAWISNDDGTHTRTCLNDNSHKETENCTDNGNGFCVCCGATLEKNEEAYIREGEKIYFGSYPQTEVTDSALKITLNNLAGTLPTSDNNRNWTSYGYYIEGKVQNYMWYIDVTSGGEKYRGVYFTSYRPYDTISSSSASDTYQDANGYYTNTAYWFKYEPIEWRILCEGDGRALIMANLILDSQAYQNEYYYTNEYYSNEYYYTNSNGAPSGTYANNYEYSTIRSWLNDNFYNTAFSELEKELIKTVTVDNSAEGRGYNPNKYACENTNDKVFLLNYEEATNSSYGFSSNHNSYDKARQLKTTDYAQSQGCYTSTDTSYLGNGFWWLRSPYYGSCRSARGVGHYGGISRNDVYNSYYGVVPALQIKLN